MWRFDDFVGTSEHRVIGTSDHRNLNGIYTDIFGGGARAQEIFEGNL